MTSIGAKPNLYCEAIELVCGGSPIGCGLVERKAQDSEAIELVCGGSPIGCGLVERKAQDRVKWEG